MCLRPSVGVCLSEALRAWISVSLSLCASARVCSASVVYSVRCVYVCLLPSAPSNRLIFHISHGQEGQEAARLRPEPGYSTVSNARHSLAPPKLSALLPNAQASLTCTGSLLPALVTPVKAFTTVWLSAATAEASSLGLGHFNFVTVQRSDTARQPALMSSWNFLEDLTLFTLHQLICFARSDTHCTRMKTEKLLDIEKNNLFRLLMTF